LLICLFGQKHKNDTTFEQGSIRVLNGEKPKKANLAVPDNINLQRGVGTLTLFFFFTGILSRFCAQNEPKMS